jgi:hypothetical protein
MAGGVGSEENPGVELFIAEHWPICDRQSVANPPPKRLFTFLISPGSHGLTSMACDRAGKGLLKSHLSDQMPVKTMEKKWFLKKNTCFAKKLPRSV